mgnify:CR=1 FL=1
MPRHVVVSREGLAPGQSPPGFVEGEDFVEVRSRGSGVRGGAGGGRGGGGWGMGVELGCGGCRGGWPGDLNMNDGSGRNYPPGLPRPDPPRPPV